MRGHNICFNGEILKSIPILSQLLLLIWSTVQTHDIAPDQTDLLTWVCTVFIGFSVPIYGYEKSSC